MAADGSGSVLVHPELRYSEPYMRTHLGCSQWAAAVGANPFQAPIELWEAFLGRVSFFEGNEATELGQALEDGVAKVAARKLGLRAAPCLTLEHPVRRWLCGTPDRLLETGDILQVKTTGLVTRQRWTILDEAWGEGVDHVPEHVLIQCMAELFVAREALADPSVRAMAAVDLAMVPPRIPERNHVAALIPGRGVCLYVIEWDEALALALLERVEGFWRYVTLRRLPPPDHTEAFAQAIVRQFPEHRPERWIDADDLETVAGIATYRSALEARDAWDKAIAYAENVIKLRIGDAEGLRGSWGSIPFRYRRGKVIRDGDGIEIGRGKATRAFGPPRWRT